MLNERKPPRVFLSHASEDKDRFVLQFATALRAEGIDVWLDKWEILPGDSLVDKIFEEGLKEAEAVIVVLSKYSIAKKWVREELNAAVVQRINKQTKLIPIVIDIRDDQVPESLKSTTWERVSDPQNFSHELKRIVAAIFQHREKPPLGAPPSYTTTSLIPISGLTRIDSIVLKTLCESVLATANSFQMADHVVSEVVKLQIGDEDVYDSIEILEGRGYVEIKRLAGGVPRGIGVVTPTVYGFHQYAQSYIDDYKRITNAVSLEIVNRKANLDIDIAQSLGLPDYLISHILCLFESQGFLRTARTIGRTHISWVSPELKRSLAVDGA